MTQSLVYMPFIATKSRSCSYLSNQIRNLASILEEVEVTIQWIPSHVGLVHNEHVDGLAKAAHNSQEITSTPLDLKELKRMTKESLQRVWQLKYEAASQDGLQIGEIKRKLEHWPWVSSKNRRTETAMARLRIGHSKLRQSLFKFHLVDDPNCTVCRVPESPAHIMEECQRFNNERVVLHQSLRKLGIHAINTKTLLGGGPYKAEIQKMIRKSVEVFQTSSDALDLI